MVTAEQRAIEAAASGSTTPALEVVWDALASVPDPEIPAISIVELGIVRDVAWNDGRLRIDVTPTYSGCPATEMIAALIRERLAAIGLHDVDLVQRLSPPWSTDWIAPEAKAKLKAFGIAPPHGTRGRVDVTGISPLRRAALAIPCPRCGSTQTTLLSQFGSTACKAQYRCSACLEPFDFFKPH